MANNLISKFSIKDRPKPTKKDKFRNNFHGLPPRLESKTSIAQPSQPTFDSTTQSSNTGHGSQELTFFTSTGESFIDMQKTRSSRPRSSNKSSKPTRIPSLRTRHPSNVHQAPIIHHTAILSKPKSGIHHSKYSRPYDHLVKVLDGYDLDNSINDDNKRRKEIEQHRVRHYKALMIELHNLLPENFVRCVHFAMLNNSDAIYVNDDVDNKDNMPDDSSVSTNDDNDRKNIDNFGINDGEYENKNRDDAVMELDNNNNNTMEIDYNNNDSDEVQNIDSNQVGSDLYLQYINNIGLRVHNKYYGEPNVLYGAKKYIKHLKEQIMKQGKLEETCRELLKLEELKYASETASWKAKLEEEKEKHKRLTERLGSPP
ncbi:uncharacterized protein BX664DRAFT_356467 [Halteromyces radiatus]|uniref:uncharacterized protein n=1 Tax=Halteromyces radiatus TaxID=101107 RepID=UPI00221EAF36|nr:uncharacterized protein BX664DRAFT_356467 [Halteromyces radiatus]KAI8097207.1 hypothetical protein BX664DRAFT_356467 [Halteromyces radiatus]